MNNEIKTNPQPLLDNSVGGLIMCSLPKGTQMQVQIDGYPCAVNIVNPTEGKPYIRYIDPVHDWRVEIEKPEVVQV